MKQRLDNAERENAIFHRLVDCIRDATDAEVAQIVEFVRSHATLVEIQLRLIRMADEAIVNQQ